MTATNVVLPPSARRYRRFTCGARVSPTLFVGAMIIGCRAVAMPAGPGRYIVTETPIDVGAGSVRLCIAVDVRFRLRLMPLPNSPEPRFSDVRILVEGDFIRSPTSGARVSAARRNDLAVPEW